MAFIWFIANDENTGYTRRTKGIFSLPWEMYAWQLLLLLLQLYRGCSSLGCTVINNYPPSITPLSSPLGIPSFSCFKLTVISYLGNMKLILLRYSPRPNEDWLHLMERALSTQDYYWFWFELFYFMVISILSCGLCLLPLSFSIYFRYLFRVTLMGFCCYGCMVCYISSWK